MEDIEAFFKREPISKDFEGGSKGLKSHYLLLLAAVVLLLGSRDAADVDVVVGIEMVREQVLELGALEDGPFGEEAHSGYV